MQQPTHPMAQISPANITTEQIQKLNLGKLAECAQYQAQLQKNLLYLAAIADAQPPTSSVRPQMVPHPAIQQGGPFGQQASAFPPRTPMQFNMQQIHEQQRQPQLMPFPGHMGMRPGIMNGMPSMPNVQTSHVGGRELQPGSSMAELPRGSTSVSTSRDGDANKQDTGKLTATDTAAIGAIDGHSSGAEHGSGEVAKSS